MTALRRLLGLLALAFVSYGIGRSARGDRPTATGARPSFPLAAGPTPRSSWLDGWVAGWRAGRSYREDLPDTVTPSRSS